MERGGYAQEMRRRKNSFVKELAEINFAILPVNNLGGWREEMPVCCPGLCLQLSINLLTVS